MALRSSPWSLLVPHAGLGDDAVSQINSALQAAGLPPNQVQSAVQAYTGLDEASTNAIIGIVDGGPISLTTMAPLIGAGLLATGVGAPIAAAVTALLPVLDGIIGMFSGPQEKCTWKVGYFCFNRTQPYGPTDPLWETWEQFRGGVVDMTAIQSWATWNGSVLRPTANCALCWVSPAEAGSITAVGQPFGTHPASVLNGAGQVVHTDALGALPGYMTVMACELTRLETGASLSLVDGFRRTYYRAWQVANEYAINGYKSPDYYALLKACADAWNRAHSASTTYTFQPINAGIPDVDPNTSTFSCDPNVTYIGLLLAGVVNSSADQTTPRDHPPITINTGTRLRIASNLRNAAASSSSSTSISTPAKVAIGASIIAGGAAIGVGIWALATKQAYGAAWDRVFKVAAKPFKRR